MGADMLAVPADLAGGEHRLTSWYR
jgi:hypothetical protein